MNQLEIKLSSAPAEAGLSLAIVNNSCSALCVHPNTVVDCYPCHKNSPFLQKKKKTLKNSVKIEGSLKNKSYSQNSFECYPNPVDLNKIFNCTSSLGFRVVVWKHMLHILNENPYLLKYWKVFQELP